MSDLLELAVAAHGGLARWNWFRALRAKMAIRGAIFEAKRIAGLQDDVTYEVQLREERVTVDQFGGSNRRLRFLPSRLVRKLRAKSGNSASPRVEATSDIAMERYSTRCAGCRSMPDRRK